MIDIIINWAKKILMVLQRVTDWFRSIWKTREEVNESDDIMIKQNEKIITISENGEFDNYIRENGYAIKYSEKNKIEVTVSTDIRISKIPESFYYDKEDVGSLYLTNNIAGMISKVSIDNKSVEVTAAHVYTELPNKEKTRFKQINPHVYISPRTVKIRQTNILPKANMKVNTVTIETETNSCLLISSTILYSVNVGLSSKTGITNVAIMFIVPENPNIVYSGALATTVGMALTYVIISTIPLINDTTLKIAIAMRVMEHKTIISFNEY